MLDPARYRFALVAHSPEVVDCVRRVARYEDYDLACRVADADLVIPAAEEFLRSGCEVVLCHGGTGRSILRALGNSAVVIDRTDMDVVKSLLQARAVSRNIVMACYLEEKHDTDMIERLIDVRIHLVVYATWAEMDVKVREAYDQGVRVLVGGGISRRCMESLGGVGFVIEPNPHSIGRALEHARAIARQKRLEAARQSDLTAIFAQLQEGVVCVDDAGNPLYVNPKAAQLLKLRPGAGRSELEPFFSSLMLAEVLARKIPCHDLVVDLPAGKFVTTTVPLMFHPGATGAVALFRDISSLQSINRKISEKLYASGFVARNTLDDIRGGSAPVRDLKQKITRFAATSAAVLITGETGVGKELVAHAIHNASDRRPKAFVATNCAALPENLIESELFGYEDGAFTGAKRGGKRGLFEMADGGTIFLDEVGEISHEVQLRLLRVLEAKEVLRVGGSCIRPVDVRVLSASHQPLLELASSGRFRLDLYYRLSTLKIAVPPLREHLDDLPLLLENLLRQYGKPAAVLSPAMLSAMRGHHWPGNVRELLSLVESYLVLLPGDAPDEDLFAGVVRESAAGRRRSEPGGLRLDPRASLRDNLELAKSAIARQAVDLHHGDKRQAARSLGVSYTTLWRMLQEAPPA